MADKRDFDVIATKSEIINEFLDKMDDFEVNKSAVAAFRESLHIYNLNSTQDYYESNSTRAKYMKRMIRESLAKEDFDWSKDKILLKMGGNHTSKGYSPMDIYDVGNMLNELADFHGSQAINIGFTKRFHQNDEGVIEDNLFMDDRYSRSMKSFIQMGKKEQWTIIDLRPILIGHFYYPQKYKFENQTLEDLLHRADFLIIPPTDKDALPIYLNK